MSEIYRNGIRFGTDNPIPVVTTQQWESMSSAEKASYKLVIVDDSIGVDPSLLSRMTNVTLSFSNKSCTVQAPLVRETSYCLVYYDETSIPLAEEAKVKAFTGNGYVSFTAETNPSQDLVCDLVFINFTTTPASNS